MKKVKKIWVRLKKIMKEIEVKDRMTDGKLSSSIIVICSFVIMVIITLICWLFG